MRDLWHSLLSYFTPARTLRLCQQLAPWMARASAAAFVFALWWIFQQSPPDALQGESVRILYIHVPAAWLSLGLYVGTALSAGVFYVWRAPLAFFLARSCAWVGWLMTTICLGTGMLWGQPTWGTWWVWDARLTSMLVLWFLYGGFLALSVAFPRPEQGWQRAAVLSFIGLLNLPIIKFSVTWWATLHQPASITLQGSHLAPEMLWPLMFMLVAFNLYVITCLCYLMVGQILEKRTQRRN